jgi:predicted DNA-binding transcriptional regulator YafY
MLTPARLRAVRAAAQTIRSRPATRTSLAARSIITSIASGRRWNSTQVEAADEEESIQPFVDTRTLKAYHGVLLLVKL